MQTIVTVATRNIAASLLLTGLLTCGSTSGQAAMHFMRPAGGFHGGVHLGAASRISLPSAPMMHPQLGRAMDLPRTGAAGLRSSRIGALAGRGGRHAGRGSGSRSMGSPVPLAPVPDGVIPPSATLPSTTAVSGTGPALSGTTTSLRGPLPGVPAGLMASGFNPENGIIAGSTDSAATCHQRSLSARIKCEEAQD